MNINAIGIENLQIENLDEFMASQAQMFANLSSDSIREEMFEYVVKLVNNEFGGTTTEDAIANWNHFKSNNGI